MDIVDFFPSITQVDLAKYIGEHSAIFGTWAPPDIDVFCKLVCRNAALTIGAPTSPALSNAICYDMDVALTTLAAKSNVRYTRYADDLFFSTDTKDVLRHVERDVGYVLSELKVPATLKVNATKTRHSSKIGARRVTGIVLGSDGHLYIGRALKREIRALIHRYDSLNDEARRSLRGKISYAVGFDPQFMNALIDKFGLPRVQQALSPVPSRASTT
jgi:RNA-directed DNA polymerase